MLFNSYEFIFLFLPVVFTVYFFLNKNRFLIPAKAWLILCSLFFYSWWNIKYLPLLLCSIIFNFSVGTALSKSNTSKKKFIDKKVILIVGIAFNLLLLGYYKYLDFFITNINILTGHNLTLMHLILPLGISFFTFTQIAYLVDAYKGEVKEMDYLNYSLFVTYFPHLIAGPILHHSEMMPQFDDKRNKFLNYKNICAGIFIFSLGLFKKVVIADTFSVWAINGFDNLKILSFVEAWTTSLSYTFQLYFDFSGYTDMAIGASLLFNIILPMNFNSPYKATNIQDFWRRWHITLSRFLRNYIYIPLGGNKNGEYKTYNNLVITFLLGGLWHGAGWTFIIWGLLHGLALVIHRFWTKFGIKLGTLVSWFITFNFVNLTWIFFRAKNFDDAIKVIKGMLGLNGFHYDQILLFNFLLFALILIVIFYLKTSHEIMKNISFNKSFLLRFLILFLISYIFIASKSEFLYFRF